MEARLGTRVFDRLPREIRTTAAGKIFEKEAALALEHCRRAASLVQAFEREKKQLLKVGLSALSNLPAMQTLLTKAQKGVPELVVERSQAYTAELMLQLLRGQLDLTIVDLPIQERGISVHPVHTESLIVALPHDHPLTVRPMVRLFELKKQQLTLLSDKADPATTDIEAMLRQSGIAPSHMASSVIELLDHVAVHRIVGLLRASTGRLRRDGVVSKPFAHSILIETAVAWRTDDRNPAMMSFRDSLIAFGQRKAAG